MGYVSEISFKLHKKFHYILEYRFGKFSDSCISWTSHFRVKKMLKNSQAYAQKYTYLLNIFYSNLSHFLKNNVLMSNHHNVKILQTTCNLYNQYGTNIHITQKF